MHFHVYHAYISFYSLAAHEIPHPRSQGADGGGGLGRAENDGGGGRGGEKGKGRKRAKQEKSKTGKQLSSPVSPFLPAPHPSAVVFASSQFPALSEDGMRGMKWNIQKLEFPMPCDEMSEGFEAFFYKKRLQDISGTDIRLPPRANFRLPAKFKNSEILLFFSPRTNSVFVGR